MKDVQSQADHRRIDIHKVGVKDISYPITVLDKAQQVQRTIARVNMYVNLPHQFKGTHMSRFVEILNRFHGDINLKSFRFILEEMKCRLQAQAAHMEITFPYFLKRKEAHGHAVEIAEYRCRMHGSLGQKDDLLLEIQVPISSPLSFPAVAGLPVSLGRWGVAHVAIRFRHFLWIEDLIQMVEEVIRHAWAHAKTHDKIQDAGFSVEKLTKTLAQRLSLCEDIVWFLVGVENLSADYSTYAAIEWPETL